MNYNRRIVIFTTVRRSHGGKNDDATIVIHHDATIVIHLFIIKTISLHHHHRSVVYTRPLRSSGPGPVSLPARSSREEGGPTRASTRPGVRTPRSFLRRICDRGNNGAGRALVLGGTAAGLPASDPRDAQSAEKARGSPCLAGSNKWLGWCCSCISEPSPRRPASPVLIGFRHTSKVTRGQRGSAASTRSTVHAPM